MTCLVYLSYRPASRKSILDHHVVPALGRIVLRNSPEHNAMSAVLIIANIAGHLSPEQCPEVTKDLQIAIKTISALQAALARQSFGGRYGTIWKVTMSVSALSDGLHNHPLLASNGAGSLMEALLTETHMNPLAQEHACKIVLRLCYDKGTRELVLRDAPALPSVLSAVMLSAPTHLCRATAEAALWALEMPPSSPPVEDGSSQKNLLMISHQILHFKYAQCIAEWMRTLGYIVAMSGSEGIPQLSSGVASSGVTLVLLSEELQTSPLSRAELLVAAATCTPVVWLQCSDTIVPAPEGWLATLPRAIAFGTAGAALAMSMAHVSYDAVSDSFQPRDAATALMHKVADVVSKYIEPQNMSTAQLDAARVESERARTAEKIAQTNRVSSQASRPSTGQSTAGVGGVDAHNASLPATPASVSSKVPLQILLDFKVAQVADWVAYNLGLPQYRDMVIQNAVDGLLLVELTDDDLLTELRIEDELHRSLILGALSDILGETSRPVTQTEEDAAQDSDAAVPS